MLTSAKLPTRLWGETVMTVIYLKNRSPTTALDQITPYEAWHGKKPDLSYLHTLGCTAYHHMEGAGWLPAPQEGAGRLPAPQEGAGRLPAPQEGAG